MNTRLLKSFMVKNGDTGAQLSEALNIRRSTLSSKMTGYRGAEFTQGEISIIKNRYKLSAREVDEIFFAKKVS